MFSTKSHGCPLVFLSHSKNMHVWLNDISKLALIVNFFIVKFLFIYLLNLSFILPGEIFENQFTFINITCERCLFFLYVAL